MSNRSKQRRRPRGGARFNADPAKRPIGVAKAVMREALAVEIANIGIAMPVVTLSAPGALMAAIEGMCSDQDRQDCLMIVAHLSMLVREFSAQLDQVAPGRVDQLLAELDRRDQAVFGLPAGGDLR